MSCKDCEKFQESEATAFYRWKNADIEIRACKEHMLEIFDTLNNKQFNRKKEEHE